MRPPITLRCVHILSPDRRIRWQLRNEFLRRLVTDFAWDENCLLVGDFNLTSGSPRFQELIHGSQLRDSRRGFGRQPSWRLVPWLPGPSLALDHLLHGDAFLVSDRFVGAVTASDHDPVVVELVLRTNNSADPGGIMRSDERATSLPE